MQLTRYLVSSALVLGVKSSAIRRVDGTSSLLNGGDVANATLDELAANALAVTKSRLSSSNGTCTADTLRIRKRWDDLTTAERTEYIDAVLCLQSKPAKTPSTLAEGAKTRYDDFVVTHINQTNYIHANFVFLSWHRLFVNAYEDALRNECGYTGYQPWWDWGASAETGLAKSPLLDGSDTSLSGDGESMNYTSSDYIVINAGTDYPTYLSAGTGGGCVTSGPFINYSVNLGPDGLSLINGQTDDSAFPFNYNPRCLKRSLTDDANQRFANYTSVRNAIAVPNDVATFQDVVNGIPNTVEQGVHGGGHFCLGGDPGRDLYVSPGDPAFWTHHSAVDRVWWIWQMLDPETRATGETAISGPFSLSDQYEPHRNGTLEDTVTLGFTTGWEQWTVADLLDSTSGPFCHVYV